MSTFRPKEVLRQAREAEEKGNLADAAMKYVQVAGVLVKKENWNEARTLYLRALTLVPELPRAQLMVAKCSARLDDPSGAQQAIREFIALSVRRGKFERYREAFESNLKQYPEMRKTVLEAVVEIDRTAAPPFLALAQCYGNLGDWKGAIRAALDALKTKTHDKESTDTLVRVLNGAGKAEAINYVQRFLEGKMSRVDLITLLEGETGGRAPAPVTEEEQDGKSLQELIRDLEVEIGIHGIEERDSVEPLVKEFRSRAKEVLKNHSKSRLDLALAFYEMGLFPHAVDELSRIDTSDPLYYEAQCVLGELYFREGVFMQAIESLQTCLRDGKASLEIEREASYKLAQVYLKLGDAAKARALLEKIAEHSPDYRQVRTLKNQVG